MNLDRKYSKKEVKRGMKKMAKAISNLYEPSGLTNDEGFQFQIMIYDPTTFSSVILTAINEIDIKETEKHVEIVIEFNPDKFRDLKRKEK